MKRVRLFNPYTPGAGFPPSYLAGRDETINDAEQTMLYVQNAIVQRSKIYYGLRGVGKTVLLNKIEEIADDKEDMQITKRMERAGEILGIPVIDHVVIGEGEFYSFKERERYREEIQ